MIGATLCQITSYTGGARLSKKRSEDTLEQRRDKAVRSTIIPPDASTGFAHRIRDAAPKKHVGGALLPPLLWLQHRDLSHRTQHPRSLGHIEPV